MRCSKCGHANSAEAKFCAQCGGRLESPCPKCGAANSSSSKFCVECGAALPPSDRQGVLGVEGSAEERRWVTVLFADISGFTALSRGMDPEDLKALAHACAERMAEQVRRFGGTVLHVAGDQIYAVFGAPTAHEDDAERAVRAALAIRDCPLAATPTGQPLLVHIGVNTGETIAGQIGPAERRDYTVMGVTVNVASRLMSVAAPGSVLVGEETFRATRGTVQYRELPAVLVKGIDRPLAVWEAVQASAISQPRSAGTAPLVGREEEMELLSRVWLKTVRESQVHLVSILGEAGIGKSRLTGEFERRILGGSAATVIRGRCLPYGEALGYWALAQALKEGAGISSEDSAQAARIKLEQWVHRVLGEGVDAGDVGTHLQWFTGLEAVPPGHSIDQAVLWASIRNVIQEAAARQPLCVIFEDIHWADDALLELIESIAARVRHVPLLIVTQARPTLLERRPNWGGGMRAYHSLLLEPLAEAASRRLLEELCRQRDLPERLIDEVGRGAGGNPLFAEELIAMIAERGVGTGIPSALKALISARLDALPPAERTLLQLAAVFGKRFSEAGLRALSEDSRTDHHLESLEHKHLIRLEGRPLGARNRCHLFKHDLIREVAYETLSRVLRRSLHRRIVDWLEQQSGEEREAQDDVLAYHASSAGQPERAVKYLVRAAEQAHGTGAHREEVSMLKQAIELSQGHADPAFLGDLCCRLGKALMSLSHWADARRQLERAMELVPSGLEQKHAEILVEASAACQWSFDVPASRRYATRALELANRVGSDPLASTAIGWLGVCAESDADFPEARRHFEESLARAPGHPCAPTAWFALSLYHLGESERSVEIGQRAVGHFRSRKDTYQTMFGISDLGMALAACGRYDEALATFQEGQQFGEKYGVTRLLARAIAMSAGLRLDLFDSAGNERIAREAIEFGRSGDFPPAVTSARIDLLFNFARRGELGPTEELFRAASEACAYVRGWHEWLWRLRLTQAHAEIVLARRDWGGAVEASERALTLIERTPRLKYQVLAQIVRAQGLHGLGRTKEAIVCLQAALATARALKDPALFLRPACALLATAGDEGLLAEARAAVERIKGALSDPGIRAAFEAAEPVRQLARYSSGSQR